MSSRTNCEVEIPYSFYGANDEAFYCREPGVMLAGPADTGKTLALLTKLHLLAYRYKNASLVIARKRLTDTFSTVLVTFRKKVLSENTPVRIYGGEKPQWFDYPTGSRIWVAGLDKVGKVLSSEHDVIYVNQSEELSLPDWEYLTTRTTGRAGNMPYSQTIGDCNPGPPSHWIMNRSENGGSLTRFDSVHRDNPELYDPVTGEITVQGERRLSGLRNLTGQRLLRLYHGLWAAPEGAIYDVFDEEKHRVKAFPIPTLWPRIVGVDPVGMQTAAVWLAYDSQSGVLNAYREYYEPFGETTSDHVENILKLSRGETIFAWIGGGPSERQARADWNGAGIPLLEPPISSVWAGIDRVYELLSRFQLVIHDNCTNLLSEAGDYRRKMRGGIVTEDIENKDQYHLLDALRYAVSWLTEPGETEQVVYMPAAIDRRW